MEIRSTEKYIESNPKKNYQKSDIAILSYSQAAIITLSSYSFCLNWYGSA